MKIAAACPHCARPVEVEARGEQAACPACGKNLLPHPTEALLARRALDQCPVCGAAHLYRQKDFNRAIGIGLLVLGVLLAWWTYGLSLLAVTLFDWILYRRVGEVGQCYQCGAQFRESPLVPRLPAFDLQLFDYYRSLR